VELADHLRCQGIDRVVLESTSDYWRPFYYLLEAAGLVVWLVNAAQAKNVPGRPKTDKIDAVWLAKLAERSMVTPSLVPAEPMRHVRDLVPGRACHYKCVSHGWTKIDRRDHHAAGKGPLCESGHLYRGS
jgi:transposase